MKLKKTYANKKLFQCFAELNRKYIFRLDYVESIYNSIHYNLSRNINQKKDL